MADFILHNYFRSSTSYRVRIALNWKDLNYDYQAVHLLADGGQQHRPEYLKLNPQGEVPTLIHKGRAIAQSFAIIEYLDEIHPSPPLFPKDAFGRAKVRQMCENINCFIHTLGNLKVQQFLEKRYGLDASKKEEWVGHWTHQGLTATEKLLSEFSGKYSFGDEVSAMDCFLVPQVFSAERFKVDLSKYENLRRINENCLQLEAFKKAHPSRQPDTPEEMRTR